MTYKMSEKHLLDKKFAFVCEISRVSLFWLYKHTQKNYLNDCDTGEDTVLMFFSTLWNEYFLIT